MTGEAESAVIADEIGFQNPNEQGYYGSFGGAYIPEMLQRILSIQLLGVGKRVLMRHISA